MNKKLISKTILILLLSSSIFAQEAIENTAENQTEIDSEVISLSETKANDGDTYTSDSDEYDNEQILTAPKKKNSFFKDLVTFGNKGKYLYTDDSSCYSKTFSGALKQFAATGIINPDTAEAGFISKNNGLFYILFLDQKGRSTLNKAADQYFNDFSNKKLDRNNKKAYRNYGKVNINMRWGTIKTSTPNYATGDILLGYEFVGKSPYFVIQVPELENLHYKETDSVSRTSQRIKFYFTKAQIQSILDMIDEKVIANTINEYVIQEYGVSQEADNY